MFHRSLMGSAGASVPGAGEGSARQSPIALFVPVITEHFGRMHGAIGTVAAGQVRGAAIAVTPPEDAFRVVSLMVSTAMFKETKLRWVRWAMIQAPGVEKMRPACAASGAGPIPRSRYAVRGPGACAATLRHAGGSRGGRASGLAGLARTRCAGVAGSSRPSARAGAAGARQNAR